MIKSKTKSFIFICAAFIFMLFFSCESVGAEFYEVSRNGIVEESVSVKRSDDEVRFSMNYQNGIGDVKVYICDSQDNCNIGSALTYFEDSALRITGDTGGRINTAQNATSSELVYSVPTSGDHLSTYRDRYDNSTGKLNNIYYLKVEAKFCITRNAEKTACTMWDNQPYVWGKKIDLDNGGLTGDSQINQTLAQMLNIVNTIVIPILWVLMAALLIIRGIMLGMDIVKSSDEPDVRKKKISGLVWLFIGVGVGYAITITANIVMGMFGYGGIF